MHMRNSIFLAVAIDLGDAKVGDSLQFSIISGIEPAKGERMYPRVEDWGGAWHVGYENWLDTCFEDYNDMVFTTEGPCYSISFDPPVASPGDTVRLTIRQVGGTVDPDSDMDVNIIEGRGFAALGDTTGELFGSDLHRYNQSEQWWEWKSLSEISNGMLLIIGSTPPPTGRIVVQVVNALYVESGRGELRIERSVLLGESKYYQAQLQSPSSSIVIREFNQPPTGQGVLGIEWSVTKVPPESEKLGAYWDCLQPLYYRDGTFMGLQGLPGGTIRLVGRYWDSTHTYKVRLRARNPTDGESDSLVVAIRRPKRLLTAGQNPPYQMAKNIRSAILETDIDSVAIEYGGKHGIPPQFLKGQIYGEAYKSEQSKFWPTYRYEPEFDGQTLESNRPGARSYRASPFFVTANGMGAPAVPTDHLNLKPPLTPPAYAIEPVRIHDYVLDNFLKYYRSSINKTLIFEDMWNNLITAYTLELGYSTSAAIESSKVRFADFLRIRFGGFYAQTRLAASYGYWQLLYPTAITASVGYPPEERPEDLCDEITEAPLVCTYTQNACELRLSKENPPKQFGDPNWEVGFETMFYLYYHRYNSSPDYPGKVLGYAKLFIPSAK